MDENTTNTNTGPDEGFQRTTTTSFVVDGVDTENTNVDNTDTENADTEDNPTGETNPDNNQDTEDNENDTPVVPTPTPPTVDPSTLIEIITYPVNATELRLNGRVLSSTMQTEINYKLKKNGTNIDLLLELGENINPNDLVITTDKGELVKTDCVGNVLGITPTEQQIGKNKLLQIPFVNLDLDTIRLNITNGTNNYTVNLIIEANPSYSTYGILAKQDGINLNTNGDEGYPKSYSNLPILLTNNKEIVLNYICSDQEGVIELTEDVKVRICYDPNVITLVNKDNILTPPEIPNPDNEEETITDTTDINNPTFFIETNGLDLDNVYKSDYYLPIVVEFINSDDKVISSRSLLFSRAYLKLMDTWGRELTKHTIDPNDSGDGMGNYVIDVITPRYSTILSPYVKHIMKTDNDVRDKTLDLIEYFFINNDFNSNTSMTFEKGITKYELHLTMTEYDPVEIVTSGSVSGSFNIENLSNINITKEPISTTTDITFDVTDIVIEKDKDNLIEFYITNGSHIEIENITPDGPVFDINYNSNYIFNLPHNGSKVYPEIYGNIVTTPSMDIVDDVYEYKLKVLDSSNVVLKELSFELPVRRPIAEPFFNNILDKYYVDIDREKTITLTCVNTFSIEIDPNSVDGYLAAINNVTHSDDVNNMGTYDEYKLDLLLSSDVASSKSIALICRDEDLLDIGRFSINIDFYTSKYNSSNPNPRSNDIAKGLIVKTSYVEKRNYGVPTAFINNGEEVAGLLVAKYPIPQESVINVKEGLLYTDLSKPNTHLLSHIPDSVIGPNDGDEGGEIVKVINTEWFSTVLENVVNNRTLEDNTFPTINSVYLDTVLGYIKDSNMLAIYNKYHKPYGLAFTSDTKDEYSYGISSGLYSTMNTGKEWKYRISNQTIKSEKYKDLDQYIDSRDDYELPLIEDNIYNSHSGTLAGIMGIGLGLKIYNDVKITNDITGTLRLYCIDPNLTKVDYDNKYRDTLDTKFREIQFPNGKFLSNVIYGYIGPNDYTQGRKHYTFSNELYEVDDYANLMDNIGLPMNNFVYDYKTNNAFPGMSGVSIVRTNRYSGSTYCMDFDKLKDEGTGYLANGGWYLTLTDDGQDYNGFEITNPEYTNHSVMKYDTDNPSTLEDHFYKRYEDVINKQSVGIYSRWLIDDSVVYNVNKNANKVNDQIVFNNRIQYYIYDTDKINRLKPSKFELLTKYILIKVGEVFNIRYIADSEPEIVTKPDDTIVKLDRGVLTGLNPGDTKIRYMSKVSEDHNPKYQIAYIRVVPIEYAIYSTPDVLELFYGNPKNHEIIISADFINKYVVEDYDTNVLSITVSQVDNPNQNTVLPNKGKIFNTLLVKHSNQIPTGKVVNNVFKKEYTNLVLTGYDKNNDVVCEHEIETSISNYYLFSNLGTTSNNITIDNTLNPGEEEYVVLISTNCPKYKLESNIDLIPGWVVEVEDITDISHYYLKDKNGNNETTIVLDDNTLPEEVEYTVKIETNAENLNIESNLTESIPHWEYELIKE